MHKKIEFIYLHFYSIFDNIGSSQPHIPNDGKLVLYSMRFCPFSHRVHLVLNAKNIPYHVVYINVRDKPEWYAKVNPNGKVPALQLTHQTDSPILVESLLICEYLDETYPDVKLFPTNPVEKSDTRIWIERFGTLADTFYRLIYEQNSGEESAKLLSEFYELLKPYEAELAKRDTVYYGGDRPNIFDYALWPWFERFTILKSVVGDTFVFDNSNYPKLVRVSLLAFK